MPNSTEVQVGLLCVCVCVYGAVVCVCACVCMYGERCVCGVVWWCVYVLRGRKRIRRGYGREVRSWKA